MTRMLKPLTTLAPPSETVLLNGATHPNALMISGVAVCCEVRL